MQTHYFHHTSIHTLDEACQLLDRLIKFATASYFLLDSDQRGARLNYDKWSPREIIGHLTDSARYNLMRFTETVIHPSPYRSKSYNQVALVKIQDYQGQDDASLLQYWQLLNRQILQVIPQITAEDIDKSIQIEEEIHTLEYVIFDYIGHLQFHLEQIFGQIDESLLSK